MYSSLLKLVRAKSTESLSNLALILSINYYTFLDRININPEKLTVEKIAILSQYLGISEIDLFNIILAEYLRKNPLKTGKAQGNAKK